jgi:hypothetical protein
MAARDVLKRSWFVMSFLHPPGREFFPVPAEGFDQLLASMH